MKKIIYWTMAIIIFVIYFKVFGFLWESMMPWNRATDVLAFFIVMIFLPLLSVLTTEFAFKAIKEKG